MAQKNYKVQIVGSDLSKAETFILWGNTKHGEKVKESMLQSIGNGAPNSGDKFAIVMETNEKRRGTWYEPVSPKGLLQFVKIAQQIAA